jgi:hypothetical protein
MTLEGAANLSSLTNKKPVVEGLASISACLNKTDKQPWQPKVSAYKALYKSKVHPMYKGNRNPGRHQEKPR